MRDQWEDDWAFRRTAQLVWPEDYALASTWGRAHGRTDARRRMEQRHEGFRAFRSLMQVRNQVTSIVAELTAGVVPGG